ncbi:hypothetical protein D3C75_1327890 [compost metagenome]
MFRSAKHQVGAQVVEQYFSVIQIGADLPLQLTGNPRQQLLVQLMLVALLQNRGGGLALIQAVALMQCQR